jgi:transposase
MFDSHFGRPADRESEHYRAQTSARPAQAKRCQFCDRENNGEVVDAGGDVGRVHRVCFIEWDREQEALELAAMVAMSLPGSGECWSEREIAGDNPMARAA